MADGEVRYETKDVRALRGTEARSIAKWQKDGWELVGQSDGALQTKLRFRRPKPTPKWLLLAAVGGGAVVLVVFAVIMGAIEGGDDRPGQDASATEEASATEQEAAPRGEPSDPPEPSEEPAAPPTPSETAEQSPLTLTDNPELAALLTGPPDGTTVEAFAATYRGRLIEFDGSVGAIAPHGDYDTRYDILIAYGD